MNAPNFFIVGAAKSGTTSLWRALMRHPEIYMPRDMRNKEPCYFVDGYGMNSLDEYLAIFPKNSYQAVGEASTAYLSSPEAPQKIFAFNPDAKIIIILRNPADRAYSLYCWMVQEGYEWIPSLEDAIAYEKKRRKRRIPNRLEPVFREDYFYFSSGLYCAQVKRYLDLFGANVKVILFEDLVKSSSDVLSECQRFLGVNELKLQVTRENPSCYVHSPKLSYALKIIDRCFAIMVPKWRGDVLVKLGRSVKPAPNLGDATRQWLLKEYAADVKQLESLIARDLSNWLGAVQ